MAEYSEVLMQEHIYWKQKAGVRWIRGGKQNTRYFHQFVIIRRCKQRIVQLKDDQGYGSPMLQSGTHGDGVL